MLLWDFGLILILIGYGINMVVYYGVDYFCVWIGKVLFVFVCVLMIMIMVNDYDKITLMI